MFNEIKTNDDIKLFLVRSNSLHDGYIIGVRYTNCGISRVENGHSFNPEQTKLVLQILVTSICDAVVEIEFENLLEWQIQGNQREIFDVSVFFNKEKLIVWTDDIYMGAEEMKKRSYVIAESMKWRFAK